MGSFFGKLFAPSRWASASVKRTCLKRQTILGSSATARQLDADEATITVVKNQDYDDLPASGTVYIGQETISYTGKGTQATTTTDDYPSETLGTLTGCTRGLYPAFSNPRSASPAEETFGQTFEYPRIPEMTDGDVGAHQPVADEPFSYVGRHVGLYVTTYDFDTGAWNSVDDAELVWAGRVSDSIRWDPSTGCWTLACDSLLSDLDRKLCAHLPSAPQLLINLQGTMGRTFVVNWYKEVSGWYHYAYCVVTVPAGYYSPEWLYQQITVTLNGTDAWTTTSAPGTALTFPGQWKIQRVDGKTEIRVAVYGTTIPHTFRFVTSLTSNFDPTTIAYTDPDLTAQAVDQPCHALRALGFSTEKYFDVEAATAGDGVTRSEDEACDAYQPLHPDFNGGVLLIEQRGTDFPWKTQGDYESGGAGGSDWACMQAEGAKVRGEESDRVLAYTAQTYQQVSVPGGYRDGVVLTLAVRRHQPALAPRDAYVGGASVIWNQVWVPKPIDVNGVPIGPIRQLLPSLLSTGTEHYNDANWDHCPPALSVGFPSSLVDKASFLRADYQITATYPESSRRWLTKIDKPTSWRELWEREAQAYGYCVAFDSSSQKLTCKPVFDLNLQNVTVELDESDTAAPDDFPVIEMSAASVLNSWTFEVSHYGTDKLQKIVVNDRESIAGLGGIVKEVTVKHPGVYVMRTGLPAITQELTIAALSRCSILRYPLQHIRRSLAATRINAVSVGDVVGLTYTCGYQDPQGSGDRSVASARALVLDVAWNFANGAGSCDLLVLPQMDDVDARPPAPSALVDRSAANGGWDSASKTLTLIANAFGESTDDDDGEAFDVDGYKILLVERAPSDRTSPATISATVAAAAYTAATRALVIDEDISGSFDTTGETEYVITFADYATATTAQRLLGTWQASRTTHLLNAADKAHSYG